MHSDHHRHYYCKALSWCWVFIYFICRVVFDARNEIVGIEQMWTSHCPHAHRGSTLRIECHVECRSVHESQRACSEMHTMHISVCTGRRFVGEFHFFLISFWKFCRSGDISCDFIHKTNFIGNCSREPVHSSQLCWPVSNSGGKKISHCLSSSKSLSCHSQLSLNVLLLNGMSTFHLFRLRCTVNNFFANEHLATVSDGRMKKVEDHLSWGITDIIVVLTSNYESDFPPHTKKSSWLFLSLLQHWSEANAVLFVEIQILNNILIFFHFHFLSVFASFYLIVLFFSLCCALQKIFQVFTSFSDNQRKPENKKAIQQSLFNK